MAAPSKGAAAAPHASAPAPAAVPALLLLLLLLPPPLCCRPSCATASRPKTTAWAEASVTGMTTEPSEFAGTWTDWVSTDTIRVCEYFYRVMEKRKFINLDGRLIPAEDDDAKEAKAEPYDATELQIEPTV
jgi:hypothetical protein